ncbi:7-cyano-7-deazaguanine synthase QueC, partial [Candidatus Bathyarchaeota archaeon]|nr:7-cyano-7-deazaguanine synthase QueC [Candidatus Bathyarchaeota archaeon]
KYGQIASKETMYARMIAEKLGINVKEVDISALENIFRGVTALCDRNIPIPSKFEPSIIVPFRNGVFLSIAVAYAVSIGAEYVFYGAHASDSPSYPDCREEFIKAFERAARLGCGKKITILAPFQNLKKHETIKLGTKLGVPYDLTWSCYLDGEKHCGKCESCINRKNAFMEAGVIDPTDYEERD